jgi:hypothetical protein
VRNRAAGLGGVTLVTFLPSRPWHF